MTLRKPSASHEPRAFVRMIFCGSLKREARMSPMEVQWIKFKRRLRRWTSTVWDQLTGGKRNKATQRIIIELIERQKAWEALDQERLEDFKRINRQSGLNEQQCCSELEACQARYLERMIAKAIELRQVSLREVPSVAWPPHFDELRDSLIQSAERILAGIPIGVRQKALQYPSGGLQSDGREPDHFLVQKFRILINQEIYLLQKKAEMEKLQEDSGQDSEARKGNRIAVVGIVVALVSGAVFTWWQISESRSQASKPSQPQTEMRQDSKVQSSPNATVIQSGRDTIINNPPPKVEAKPEPKTESKPPGQANLAPVPKPNAVQTMVNSPGGVQAFGNVTISSDRRIIHSMELHVRLEIETAKAAVSDEARDFGLTSVVAIFARDGKRVRFESDATIRDQQISANVRRLSFVYRPENPSDVLGKPVESLAGMEAFAVDYSEILTLKQVRVEEAASRLLCKVLVNGVAVGQLQTAIPKGVIAKRGLSWNAEKVFAEMPVVYHEALSRLGKWE